MFRHTAALQMTGELGRKRLVLRVPDNQAAVFLHHYRRIQTADNRTPKRNTLFAQTDDFGRCLHRFGRRRQHGRGNISGGLRTVAFAFLKQLDRNTLLCQLERHQTARQTATEYRNLRHQFLLVFNT